MDLKEMFPMKLGFGGLRLPVKGDKSEIDETMLCKMVDTYVEAGGRYFDTSYIYHKGESERMFGKCVVDRLPRDSFCLADKMPLWAVGGEINLQKVFDTQLQKTHVDYFDFYLLHNMNRNAMKFVEESGAFEFQQKLKKEGKIRYAGLSFHDTAQRLDRILTEHKGIDFVQLQINYHDWLSGYVQSKKCYETAAAHGIPVVVMETVRGGGLVKLPPEAKELLRLVQPGMSEASLAVRFAASLENVMMVLSGMSTLEQVQDNCSYMRADRFERLSDAEYETIACIRKILRQNEEIPCSRCGACIEVCPQKIDIAKAFEIYNDARLFGDHNFPDMHYNIHVREHRAADCMKCGACERVCPNQLPVMDKLEMISEIYDAKDR